MFTNYFNQPFPSRNKLLKSVNLDAKVRTPDTSTRSIHSISPSESYFDTMSYLNTTLWVTGYFVAGIGVLINLLGDAYYKTLDICDMYPQMSFQETLMEEMMTHSTRLPFVRIYVPTLYLLGTFLLVYTVKHGGLFNRGWPLLVDLLSGRWLYHQVVEVFPTL